jgi:hypothetical protein
MNDALCGGGYVACFLFYMVGVVDKWSCDVFVCGEMRMSVQVGEERRV